MWLLAAFFFHFCFALIPPFTSCPAQSRSDPRSSPSYMDGKIKHITDQELFDSLDLSGPEWDPIQGALKAERWQEVYARFHRLWPQRSLDLYHYTHLLVPRRQIASAYQAHPDTLRDLLAEAGKLLRHEIRGWGNVTFKFGRRVDFNADYGRSGKYGFHYWTWSFPLLHAYIATGKDRYIDCFESLFNQWYDQRDNVVGAIQGLDAIWYELGLGVRNLRFLEYLHLDPQPSPTTVEQMLKTLLGAARWLDAEERYRGYQPGNWQITGAFGLASIALHLPEFREADRWLEIATKRLEEHAERDFFSDGCHSERVPASYTVVSYRGLRNFYVLAREVGVETSVLSRFEEPLGRAIDWLTYAVTPLGCLPAVNDGWHVGHFSADLLVDGARLFHRPEALFVARQLMSSQNADEGSPPVRESVNYPVSGFAFLRCDWARQGLYMSLDYGPYGGGHTHNAILDFELYGYGRALAVDAGIGLTYDDPLQETWYKTAPAHNTVVIDGDDPDRQAAVGENIVWFSQDSVDFWAGSHRGYESSKGALHRRQVAFVKPEYWLVYDHVLIESAGHRLTWNLHLPLEMMKHGAGFVSREAPGLEVLYLGDNWQARLDSGWAAVDGLGFDSTHAVIDWLSFGREGIAGDNEIAVLLHPFRRADRAATILDADCGAPGHVTVTRGRNRDHLVFAEPNGSVAACNFVSTDGKFALVREVDGKPVYAVLVQGSKLVVQGAEVYAAPRPTDAEFQLR